MARHRRITIEDVAREAGVSITTVSRFLNQDYGAMREETKNRIQSVIEQLGYHPNKFAQGLKRNRSKTIAVVVVNLGYPFCVGVIRSLSDALHQAGYSLLVAETGAHAEREEKVLRSLMAQPVDGIVIQTNGANNGLVEEIAKSTPVVLIDRQFDVPGAVNIVTDNAEASEQLTANLFAQGYERVLYVTEELQQISTRVDRLRGYEAACRKAGKLPWVAWIERARPSTLQEAVNELKATRPQKPFAVYSANGLIMLDLYPLIRQLDYQVPSEMGIATFDEPDWAKIATPPLTCVRQPTREIGKSAADELLIALRSKQDASVRRTSRIILPSKVIPAGATLRLS